MGKPITSAEHLVLRDVAVKVRAYMLNQNISYNTIAKNAGVNPGTVSRLVRRREGINILNLSRICTACGLVLSAILAERGL